ncbi:MAG TPA: histidine kinase, partial [Conexibacter sp.]|nr:histidine kinase [Conexibacter sp.]
MREAAGAEGDERAGSRAGGSARGAAARGSAAASGNAAARGSAAASGNAAAGDGSRRLLRWGDAALLGGLAGVAIVEAATVAPDVPSRGLALAVALALIAPLTVRRDHPLLVCWSISLCFALAAASGVVNMDETSGCQLTLLVAVVAMARHTDRLGAVVVTAVGLSVLASLGTGLFSDGLPRPGDVLFGFAFIVAAVAFGRALRSGALRTLRRRIELDAVHGEQEAADAAARQERRRLARELHDLCSHHLVVAALHASIAAREVERAPEAVAAPLAIARTAVDRTAGALAELTGAAPAGLPDGAAALDAALEQARTLGARVTVAADAVPDAVALTAARIVQESLTNAAKHAAGAPVAVTLSTSAAALEVTVR